MKIVNLTPHAITVEVNGERTTFPASGQIARVATTSAVVGELAGAPVSQVVYGEINIPVDVESEDTYIVSGLVLAAAKAANHPMSTRLIGPDTGPNAVRENGQIVAVRGWVR